MGLGVESVGDLIRPGTYRPHSRFPRAVNFSDGDSLIAVVDRSVGAGPVNIVTGDLAGWEFRDLEMGADFIHAAGREMPLHDVPRYDSSLPIPENTDSTLFDGNLAVLRGHLIGTASEESVAFLLATKPAGPTPPSFQNALRSRFSEAADLIRRGQPSQGAALIKGLGRGLTPQGDDFTAGLLYALQVRGRVFGESADREIDRIHAAARSDNPFSRALLDCAAQGRPFQRLKDLIRSLFGADRGAIERQTRAMMSIGATSGADIAAGLVLGLERQENQ